MDINLFLSIVDLINRFDCEPHDPKRIGSRTNPRSAQLAVDVLEALEPVIKKVAAGKYNLEQKIND